MATFNNFCLMVVFMISSALLLQNGLSYDIPPSSNDPPIETYDAPSPVSSYQKHLDLCVMNLNPNCGENIFYSVFFGNRTLTTYCCDNLVNDLGKRCHHDLIEHLLELPNFKTNRNQILHRSDKVWNDCLIADFTAPQPDDGELVMTDES